MKEGAMGGACSIHGRIEEFLQNLGWKTWKKETTHLKDLKSV
jgi:hypothetical protein